MHLSDLLILSIIVEHKDRSDKMKNTMTAAQGASRFYYKQHEITLKLSAVTVAVAASYGTGALAAVTAVATAGSTAIAAVLLEAIALEGTCALATMPSQLVHL